MKIYSKFLAASAAIVMSAAAFAADATPAGNWKWTAQGRNGPQENTAKLEVKDGKVTGTVTNPRGDMPVTEGTFKDGNVSFTTEFAVNDFKIVSKFTGKLEGDTIKGTIERPGRDGGAPTKTEWLATRVK